MGLILTMPHRRLANHSKLKIKLRIVFGGPKRDSFLEKTLEMRHDRSSPTGKLKVVFVAKSRSQRKCITARDLFIKLI